MQPRRPPAARPPPLAEADMARLQALLDALPAPLEPLDTAMLDGYLCGVLLQPQPVAEAAWLPHALDARDADDSADAAPPRLPAGLDTAALAALLRRRQAELDDAISRRDWFDPWVFEHADGDSPHAQDQDQGEIDAVYPWVAGFAYAMSRFPRLMAIDDPALLEPLALVLRYVDADDLDDADALLAEIETLEPPADLADAVEQLVRATLLLADVSRPRAPAPRPGGRARPPRRRPQAR